MSMRSREMDEELLAQSCSDIAKQLASRHLGVEPSDTIRLDLPEQDHVARLWAYPRDGADTIAYRLAGFDMRRPRDAIRRMAAAYVAFHHIAVRADTWHDQMAAYRLAPDDAPAWALYVPHGIRPLMQPDARDAYDRWIAGEGMGDAFEGTGTEVHGNGAELVFHSQEQTGLKVEIGRVVYTIDPLPASVTMLLPGRPLADVIGDVPHGIPLGPEHIIHSAMRTGRHELELHIATGRWSPGAAFSGSSFVLPQPVTIGCRPGRTDAGWGWD